MAELTPGAGDFAGAKRWSAAQTRAQFAAIAWLRWRIVVNAFRRKGGAGELVARILLLPIFAAFALAPTVGAGAAGWYLASRGQLGHIAWVLWVVFVICQLLNINLGQPGTTFDPTQLIRFPMRVSEYIAVRLFFGLLSPANVVGTMMVMAVAVGISIAKPGLWLVALVALGVFAAVNVLFSRMVFAWVDRWLSTRRAREVFTGIIFAASMLFQYVNVTFNLNGSHRRHHHGEAYTPDARVAAAQRFYARAEPVLALLPPGLTGNGLAAADEGRYGGFAAEVLGCGCFGLLFLGVFAGRMRTEFRGENLSDQANAVSSKADVKLGARVVAPALGEARGAERVSPVSAILAKELVYVRRNTGLFYGLVAPIVMVFLFAGRMAMRGSGWWVFPAALAYTMLGIAPLSYNSFGLEGTGAQFYFMAPVRLRDVFFAKNLMNFLLAAVEVVAVFGIVSYVAAVPPLQTTVEALLWAAGTLLMSTTLGNRRSVSAPKKVDPNRTAGKQSSPLSALIALGILLGAAGVAFGLMLLARYFNLPWLLLPVLLAYFAAGLAMYLHGLRGIDRFALAHRDELFEELCKK